MGSAARHRVGPGHLLGSLGALGDLAVARTCGGCGVAGTRWCPGCAASLTGPLLRRVVVLPQGASVPVWSASAYATTVQAALVAWKDRDRPDLGPILAAATGRAARSALAELDLDPGAPGLVVVPAPSSAAARRARGWHPVRDLAGRTAVALRRRGVGAAMLPVLRQRRGVRDQAGLAADQRAVNLAGSLWVPQGWRAQLRGRPCLILDDVVTTGATVSEAARALSDAGAGPLVAATVAATALRRTDSFSAWTRQ